MIRLLPRSTPDAGKAGIELMDRVVKASFSQRRKTLSNSLGALLDKEAVRTVVADLGWPSNIRGETLTRAQFVQLTDALLERGLLTS